MRPDASTGLKNLAIRGSAGLPQAAKEEHTASTFLPQTEPGMTPIQHTNGSHPLTPTPLPSEGSGVGVRGHRLLTAGFLALVALTIQALPGRAADGKASPATGKVAPSLSIVELRVEPATLTLTGPRDSRRFVVQGRTQE